MIIRRRPVSFNDRARRNLRFRRASLNHKEIKAEARSLSSIPTVIKHSTFYKNPAS